MLFNIHKQFSPDYFSGLSESSQRQPLQSDYWRLTGLPTLAQTSHSFSIPPSGHYTLLQSDLTQNAHLISHQWLSGAFGIKSKSWQDPHTMSCSPCMWTLQPPRSSCTGPPTSPSTLPPSLITFPCAPCSAPDSTHHSGCRCPITKDIFADASPQTRQAPPHRLKSDTLPFPALTTPIPFVSTRLEA